MSTNCPVTLVDSLCVGSQPEQGILSLSQWKQKEGFGRLVVTSSSKGKGGRSGTGQLFVFPFSGVTAMASKGHEWPIWGVAQNGGHSLVDGSRRETVQHPATLEVFNFEKCPLEPQSNPG